MKKKKEKNIESILARAEKFFLDGNFSLAMKEFETAQKKLTRGDIAAKIACCRKALKTDNAKQLVKKARKAEKKGDLGRALKCFQQANAVLNEAWIAQRIENFKWQLTGRDAVSLAKAAEAAGDLLRAATCYAKACDARGGTSEPLLLKRARCLVGAGRYAEAVDIFKTLPLTKAGGRYDYGFALAQMGCFSQCLRVWEDLEVNDDRFAEQKRVVARRLGAHLVDCLKRKDDYASIYRDAFYLLKTDDALLTPDQRRSVENLYAYGRSAWIEELWEAEEFEAISDILTTASGPLTPALVALNAKVWFKMAEDDGRRLHTMLIYWLPAIYSPSIAESFSGSIGEWQKVRQKLIAMAENLIKKHDDTRYGGRALTNFTIDKELIQTLAAFLENQEKDVDLICTPGLAAHLGRSDEVLSLISANEAFFENKQQYLEFGAHYTAAGNYLYRLKNNAYEEAAGLLTDLQPDLERDEFIDYAMQLISFEYGLHRLENGDTQTIRYFQSTPALFDIAPALERKLTQKALAFEAWDLLKSFEDVLFYIHNERPSKAVRKALSLVMARRAVAMSNNGQSNPKALKGIVNKALKLDPENEMATGVIQDTVVHFEMKAMYTAFKRQKMGKASRIARESEYDEVRDHYFGFIEESFDQIMANDWEREEKLMMINDLYKWGTTVGALQPIMDRLEIHLNMNQSMVNG